MGTDVFDPDNDAMPDFCRDVLGWQTDDTPESPRAVTPVGKIVWSFLCGVFLGMAFGFAIGITSNPILIRELWR